jgi:hypothetical protein
MHLRADQSRIRPELETADQHIEPAPAHPGVVVQQDDEAPGGKLAAGIATLNEAAIRFL